MKYAAFFGAGQVGEMVARLVGEDYHPMFFIDNDPSKWDLRPAGLRVLPIDMGLFYGPDCVFLCVSDEERAAQMEKQLREMDYDGEILRPDALKIFDPRYAMMSLLAEQICELHIPGDVYKGAFASRINRAFRDRTLHLFDTFEGFAESDISTEHWYRFSKAKTGEFSDTSVEAVRRELPFPEKAVFYKGCFPNSFSACHAECFAFVSIDADLYAPTAAALPRFWDKLSKGGVLMIHDVNSTQYRGVKKAVDVFCASRGIIPMPVCDLHGSVILRKT